MAVITRDEVRTEVAMSRTEDDLVMLSPLYAVLHQVAVDTHVTVGIFTVSLRSMGHT